MSDTSTKHRRRTATTRTVASINQGVIIRALRDHGPLSRQRIGDLTGLSPATVNRLTAAMLQEGLLVVDGQEPSTGGRPSLILRYTGGPRRVVSLHLRRGEVRGALVDFDGNIVTRETVTFSGRARQSRATVEHRIQDVQALLHGLVTQADSAGTPCQAIGLAVPGVVTGTEGGVGVLPELGWHQVPFLEELTAHTTLPVVVENDANALAYAESVAGAGAGMDSVVGLLLDNGMGSGIITQGAIHRGRHGEAGEIGYLLMDRSSLGKSYAELGDLEDRVGSEALTREAHRRGISVPRGRRLTAHDVIDLAAGGNAEASVMLDEILDMVAMAVAAISVIVDPDVIVVGSGLTQDTDDILAKIEQRLRGRILRVPRLVPSALGQDAVLRGVAELAIRVVDDAGLPAPR